jgi:carbonic anhydrase
MASTNSITAALFTSLLFTACAQEEPVMESTHQVAAHSASSKGHAKHNAINTASEALSELKAGNRRFMKGEMTHTNYQEQIEQTAGDQHPHSVILSCLDSRIPPEVVFDQGMGNIFVARVAGNVEDPNVLGSMEFATKVKGSKLIVVMGHDHCGAVKGAVDDAQLGSLTQLCDQIKPAITGDSTDMEAMLDETSRNNVRMTMADILHDSPVIKELVDAEEVAIVGAYYSLETGKVRFIQ